MNSTFLNHIKTPSEISMALANRVKQTRIRRSITQEELAERSGVSFGSVKRFEQTGEISLKHLILISKVLRSSEQFDELFSLSNYESMEELLKEKEKGKRMRARARDTK
jgi:transcriptional regulator with XRE-family HTH domain